MNNTITANTINELYTDACNFLLSKPDVVYDKESKLYTELINTTLVLMNPYDHVVTIPARKLSLRYMFGEFAFYMKGSNKLKDINKYSKFWNTISDDGETVSSGYGYKLFNLRGDSGMNQYEHALHHLRKNKFSKRATMLINTPENSVTKTKDTPCTMFLQFFIRNNQLHLTTNMRSNDIFFGVPYDISFFTMLQELTIVNLRKQAYPNLQMGIYTHRIGSLHMYEKDYSVIVAVAHAAQNWMSVQESICPIMRLDTLDQMKIFLNIESGIAGKDKVTDPFLVTALKYIQGEK